MIKDDGFTSTTVSQNYAKTGPFLKKDGKVGVVMKILVPEGTKGAYLPAHGGFGAEYEMLLQSGAHFQILEKKKMRKRYFRSHFKC